VIGSGADVLVIGAGPAGRALAAACGLQGLRTLLVDRAPDAPWRATYCAWADELPAGLPAATVAVRARGRAVAIGPHSLGWEYAVLDVPALRAHLDGELARAGVELRTGRVHGPHGRGSVSLVGGGTLTAAVVVDAGGAGQPLRRPPAHRVTADQTAYGVVVPAEAAAPLVAADEALFMDWRPDHGRPGWPTFLYGVPLGGSRVLLEETSLARRPGLGLPELRDRLTARLAHHEVVVPAGAEVEKVRFAVDSPRHRTPGVLGFGAAAPLVHPASGFSVATALALAPRVAAALAAHLPGSPAAALAAADAVVWPSAARAVHRFRRIGLEALLRMPPADVPAFFERFFALPERHRWNYLTARDDLGATAATMTALFAGADWRLRARLMAPALLPAARALPGD
jgi:lycopene beta-cyclase